MGTFIKEHSHSAQDVLSSRPKVRSKLAATIISTKLRLQPGTTPNQIKAAYAIVSTEGYDDWHWFLAKLKEATRSADVTIISDRHKNILSSVAEVFGKENHGYCY